jgi:hypothetical protein
MALTFRSRYITFGCAATPCACIERGHGPSTGYYGHSTLNDLNELPAVVGLK